MNTDIATSPRKPNTWIKWLLIAAAFTAVVLFLTNPDQAAHLTAIREVIKLRQPISTGLSDILLRDSDYNNYGLFSTVTCNYYITSSNKSSKTMSFGILGRIQTTNDIAWRFTP